MKKIYFLIFVGLFIAAIAYGMTSVAGEESLTTASGSCSNCPTVTGTLTFCYDGEHATDSDTATGASGALAGTVTGATIHGDYAICGSYGVLIDASAENITWASTTDNTDIDAAEGTIAIEIETPASWSGTNLIFSSFVDISNRIYGYINSSGFLVMVHQGVGSSVTVTGNDAVPTSSTATLYFSWSVSGNAIAVQVDSNGWDVDADADTVTDFVTDEFAIGDAVSGGEADDFNLDNVKIYSDYQH